jgi:hypothetical protein
MNINELFGFQILEMSIWKIKYYEKSNSLQIFFKDKTTEIIHDIQPQLLLKYKKAYKVKIIKKETIGKL